MRSVIFVFVHESDHDMAENAAYLTPSGKERVLRVLSLLKQVDPKDFGKLIVSAEKLSYANLSAELFAKRSGINPDSVELHCGVCDEAHTMIELYAPTHDTIVLFDLIRSVPLYTEYIRLIKEYELNHNHLSFETYSKGDTSAIVIDLEKSLAFRILGESMSSTAV